jgi:hypothetical protein
VTEALDALAAAGAAVVGDAVDDALLDELQAAKKMEAPATTPMVKARGRLWFERREVVICSSEGNIYG